MLRLAGAEGIPENLAVHVGMVIDESRRNDQAIGVNGASSRATQPADLGDLAVFDADIGDEGR